MLGSRGAKRAPRTHYPNEQGPDVEAGGGGGGGTAPTAPSDVTTPVPANFVMGWGNKLHMYADMPAYQGYKNTLGYSAFTAHVGFLLGYGGAKNEFKATTAAGDATPGPYDVQRAYEGLPSVENGQRSGCGPIKGKQAGHVSKVYMKMYFAKLPYQNPGPYGDSTDTALRAAVCAKINGVAGFGKNFGADGIAFDLETGDWSTPPPGSGLTSAQYIQVQEQFAYEVGTTIWTTWPQCEINIYSLQFEQSWHQMINDYANIAPANTFKYPGTLNANISRAHFLFGLARAHKDLNVTAPVRWLDHWWYRYVSGVPGGSVSAATAYKWNSQGSLASISRYLDPAVWSQFAPYFSICAFAWAGIGNTTGFYQTTQEHDPAWVNSLEEHRKASMGGYRAIYQYDGLPNSNTASGFNAPNPDEYTPSTRPAGMLAATSSSTSYSSVAPTLAATKSGSGSTRTLTGTASHPLGIWRVKAYIYPSGTPVHAQMTFNTGGGSPTTGITNSYMDWTASLTGVSAGNYAIVTAYSVQNQQKSVVVAL
jgi:hypothetical protein